MFFLPYTLCKGTFFNLYINIELRENDTMVLQLINQCYVFYLGKVG